MVWNLPNILTLFRMCLIPVFAALYYNGMQPLALIVYLLAGATDVLDGYLARKWNQITSFGKLMDPLADKLMNLTMIFCLTHTGYIPVWVLIVLLAKELLMVAGSLALLKGLRGEKVVVMANWAGKAATALTIAAVALVFPWHNWEAVRTIGQVLMYIGVGFNLFAMVNYALTYVKKLSAAKVG